MPRPFSGALLGGQASFAARSRSRCRMASSGFSETVYISVRRQVEMITPPPTRATSSGRASMSCSLVEDTRSNTSMGALPWLSPSSFMWRAKRLLGCLTRRWPRLTPPVGLPSDQNLVVISQAPGADIYPPSGATLVDRCLVDISRPPPSRSALRVTYVVARLARFGADVALSHDLPLTALREFE